MIRRVYSVPRSLIFDIFRLGGVRHVRMHVTGPVSAAISQLPTNLTKTKPGFLTSVRKVVTERAYMDRIKGPLQVPGSGITALSS